jgi:hypothetical protein
MPYWQSWFVDDPRQSEETKSNPESYCHQYWETTHGSDNQE